MVRLLIANDCPEQVPTMEFSKGLAIWSQRILWHVQDNDIVILPVAPEEGYLNYITELLDVNLQSLQIIIAPPGNADNLSADRITSKTLEAAVRKAIAGRHVEAVIPLTPDKAIVALAYALGIEESVLGAAFASQNGGMLANSKAVFRAIAAGANAPIPAGTVTNDPQEAIKIIQRMVLEQQYIVIVKKEFGQGCRGNEVLGGFEGIIANGARRNLVLSNRESIQSYIVENWDWLTDGDKYSVIIERYFPESVAIFAEFNITDSGAEFAGIGEMLAFPIADGQVVPPVGLSPTTVAKIVEGGQRLSAAMHAIGYRGMLSADAIVTPDNTVLFTEYNGRITGSTHIYASVGKRMVGDEWMQKRILLERRGWTAPSFQAAVDRLKASGLAFNSKTRQGVVLTGTFIPVRNVISYTVVAENLAAAMRLEEQLHRVSPRAIETPA